MTVIKELYWNEVKCEDKIKERVKFQCGLWIYKNMQEAKDALKSYKKKLLNEEGWEIEDEEENWFRAKNNLTYLVFEIIEIPENVNTYVELY